jgi:hypothetical protein
VFYKVYFAHSCLIPEVACEYEECHVDFACAISTNALIDLNAAGDCLPHINLFSGLRISHNQSHTGWRGDWSSVLYDNVSR